MQDGAGWCKNGRQWCAMARKKPVAGCRLKVAGSCSARGYVVRGVFRRSKSGAFSASSSVNLQPATFPLDRLGALSNVEGQPSTSFPPRAGPAPELRVITSPIYGRRQTKRPRFSDESFHGPCFRAGIAENSARRFPFSGFRWQITDKKGPLRDTRCCGWRGEMMLNIISAREGQSLPACGGVEGLTAR